MIPGGRHFCTTHWSLVVASGQVDSDKARAALEELCRVYWFPVYCYVRKKVHDWHEAQDLTQTFFSLLIARNDFGALNPAKGRFRAYLLTALNHFLANHWDHTRRLKRGGGQVLFSWDATAAEERFRLEPASNATPERIFDQRWLETLLARVLSRLQEESQSEQGRFDELKVYLVDDRGTVPFATMAERLGISEAAVKGVVRRMRARYREFFREEVAKTVSGPEELDREIRELLASLAG
jgi:RNA polymerase sigma-70 factor (ECF subfamily)